MTSINFDRIESMLVRDERGYRIQKQHVCNQTFDLGAGSDRDVLAFDCLFENCIFNLNGRARYALLDYSTFDNCRFIAKSAKRGLNWKNVRYSNCTFEGIFQVSSFGFKEATFRVYSAGLTNCDFSSTRLDFCSLGNADMDSLRLPTKEPHITILSPDKYVEEVISWIPEWPMQGFLEIITLADEQVSAKVMSLQYLKRKKYPQEQVDRFLAKCREAEFIRINF